MNGRAVVAWCAAAGIVTAAVSAVSPWAPLVLASVWSVVGLGAVRNGAALTRAMPGVPARRGPHLVREWHRPGQWFRYERGDKESAS